MGSQVARRFDRKLDEILRQAAAVFCARGYHQASIRDIARAVGRIKRAVCSGLEMSLGEGLALERELQQHLFQSQDAHEGLSAYVEKRTPNFKAK